MKNIFYITLILILPILSLSQDKVTFKEKKDGFYQDSIQTGISNYENSTTTKKSSSYLSLDFSKYKIPESLDEFDKLWHNQPLSQGSTGTCWCFASVSLLESEVKRIHGTEVKLSEMYVVYWEYVARARYFVKTRGDVYLGQGSESNAVTRIIKEHGIVPAVAYTGKKTGQVYHNHGPLFKEFKSYLSFVKENNIWDEEAVESNVREILDHYLGSPPEKISFNGKEYTPLDFMKNAIKINPDDYFCFMSTKSKIYNQKGELEEPDNWWHNDDYYNISLDDFYSIFIEALDKGYTLSICGDVSEPGYDRYSEAGIIPSFDIPEDYINEDSREFRVNNKSTTDDHCIHIVGYTEKDKKTWFLIKDSSSSGFDGPNKGYRFIREDYVRLKILAVMVHKYGASDILDNIIK